MSDTGVYIFRWGGTTGGLDGKPPSENSSIEDGLQALEYQMTWMQDITLVGHSKGGNLVLRYLQQGQYHPQLRNAVTLSTPNGDGPIGTVIAAIAKVKYGEHVVPEGGPTVVMSITYSTQ